MHKRCLRSTKALLTDRISFLAVTRFFFFFYDFNREERSETVPCAFHFDPRVADDKSFAIARQADNECKPLHVHRSHCEPTTVHVSINQTLYIRIMCVLLCTRTSVREEWVGEREEKKIGSNRYCTTPGSCAGTGKLTTTMLQPTVVDLVT